MRIKPKNTLSNCQKLRAKEPVVATGSSPTEDRQKGKKTSKGSNTNTDSG